MIFNQTHSLPPPLTLDAFLEDSILLRHRCFFSPLGCKYIYSCCNLLPQLPWRGNLHFGPRPPFLVCHCCRLSYLFINISLDKYSPQGVANHSEIQGGCRGGTKNEIPAHAISINGIVWAARPRLRYARASNDGMLQASSRCQDSTVSKWSGGNLIRCYLDCGHDHVP